MAKMGLSTSTLLWAVGLSATYGAASFLWSAIGFASPITPVHFHEYSLPALAREVGGHLLFGVVAAAPTLDAGLILLAGGESVLIDSDHLLAALGYPIGGRMAHSVFFALAVACLLAYLSGRSGRGARGVFFVTLAAVAAHIGYDVLAGNGTFYFLSPFSLDAYVFPGWAWAPLLLAGVALSLVGAREVRIPFRQARVRRRGTGQGKVTARP